jgi:hypothetical protein
MNLDSWLVEAYMNILVQENVGGINRMVPMGFYTKNEFY